MQEYANTAELNRDKVLRLNYIKKYEYDDCWTKLVVAVLSSVCDFSCKMFVIVSLIKYAADAVCSCSPIGK